MELPQRYSPEFYNPSLDSFLSHIGTSDFPGNQFGDYISLGDLGNHPKKKDIHSLIDYPPAPAPTPTPTPTSTIFSLPSLPHNDKQSGPCITRENQFHSSDLPELGSSGRDDSSKQVLVVECAAALSQGGPIASSTQSLPALNPVQRKQKSRKLSTTRQTITKEDLVRQFGKNRAEAAKFLKVSISTLKRKARMFGIICWPSSKSMNRDMSVDESLLSPTSSSYVVVDPVSSMQPELEISSPPKQLGTKTTAQMEEKPMTVKVKYIDDYVKFEIFSASKADLEEEISKRLKLEVGSFKIKYLDEEKDLVSITCDVDLQLCKRIETSFHFSELKEG